MLTFYLTILVVVLSHVANEISSFEVNNCKPSSAIFEWVGIDPLMSVPSNLSYVSLLEYLDPYYHDALPYKAPLSDDQGFRVELSFPFKFNSVYYKTIYVCYNGYISFGTYDCDNDVYSAGLRMAKVPGIYLWLADLNIDTGIGNVYYGEISNANNVSAFALVFSFDILYLDLRPNYRITAELLLSSDSSFRMSVPWGVPAEVDRLNPISSGFTNGSLSENFIDYSMYLSTYDYNSSTNILCRNDSRINEIVQFDFNKIEYNALVSFYNNTNGTHWRFDDNWLSNVHPCKWFGIWCDIYDNESRIKGIYLTLNNVNGSIFSLFPQIGQDNQQFTNQNGQPDHAFKHLVTMLFLKNPLLTGNISNIDWSVFEDLEYIYNNRCKFTGSFNEVFTTMQNLICFDFRLNQLSGTLFEPEMSMTKLISIRFDSNKISGSIPRSFSNLVNLSYININDNLMTGNIMFIDHLDNMIGITMDNNQFTGPLPLFRNMSNLSYIMFANNKLNGTIAQSIGDSLKLKTLSLSNNSFSGQLPHTLSKLSNLKTLLIGLNKFSGTLPTLKSPVLSAISIQDNRFTGSIKYAFSNLELLNMLKISNNQFTGDLPILHKNAKPSIIMLANNRLSGSIYQFVNTAKLAALALSGNCIDTSLESSNVDWLCSASGLNYLSLDAMNSACFKSSYDSLRFQLKRSMKVPDCVWSLPNMQVLSLSGNSFHLDMPSTDKISTNFVDVNIMSNKAYGEFPRNFIKSNPHLETLIISRNFIYGRAPDLPSPDSKSKLKTIDFTINHFSCDIDSFLNGIIPYLDPNYMVSMIKGNNLWECPKGQFSYSEVDADSKSIICAASTYNIIFSIIGAVSAIVFIYFSFYFYKLLVSLFKHLHPSKYMLSLFYLSFESDLHVNMRQDASSIGKHNEYMISLIRWWNLFTFILLCILVLFYPLYNSSQSTFDCPGYWEGSIVVANLGHKFIVIILFYPIVFIVSMLVIREVKSDQISNTIIDQSIDGKNTQNDHDQGQDQDKVERNEVQNSISAEILSRESLAINTQENKRSQLIILRKIYAFALIFCLGINMAYIYLLTSDIPNGIKTIVQVLTGIIITLFINAGIPAYFKYLNNSKKIIDTVNVRSRVILSILCFIVISCVASGFLDFSCFLDLISPPPPIYQVYNKNICLVYVNDGSCGFLETEVTTIKIQVPFIYTYNCSRATIFSTTSIYLITYLFELITNLVIYFIPVIFPNPFVLPRIIYSNVPKSIWYFHHIDYILNEYEHKHNSSNEDQVLDNEGKVPIDKSHNKDDINTEKANDNDNDNGNDNDTKACNIRNIVLKLKEDRSWTFYHPGVRLTIHRSTLLSMMLTFGVFLPIQAVIIWVIITCDTIIWLRVGAKINSIYSFNKADPKYGLRPLAKLPLLSSSTIVVIGLSIAFVCFWLTMDQFDPTIYDDADTKLSVIVYPILLFSINACISIYSERILNYFTQQYRAIFNMNRSINSNRKSKVELSSIIENNLNNSTSPLHDLIKIIDN